MQRNEETIKTRVHTRHGGQFAPCVLYERYAPHTQQKGRKADIGQRRRLIKGVKGADIKFLLFIRKKVSIIITPFFVVVLFFPAINFIN